MTSTRTSRLARVAFALLVVATVGAFFVAQRLKGGKPAIDATVLTRNFSPLGVGPRTAAVSIRLRSSDDITVYVVSDRTDEAVRRLAQDRQLAADQTLVLHWDGRRDNGTLGSSGRYRVQILLRQQGRATFAHKRILLISRPPNPTVFVRTAATLALAKRSQAPAVLPSPNDFGGGALARVRSPERARRRQIVYLVYRTDLPGAPSLVARFFSQRNRSSGVWDGRIAGAPAPAGTYFIAARVRDIAGNIGTTQVRRGARGSPGVTVRYISSQPPTAPVRAGRRFVLNVDARGQRYRWALRRIGVGQAQTGGMSNASQLRLRAPAGPSGAYVVELTVGTHTTSVPFAVTTAAHSPVLVVLPLISWQGRNPADDTGSGFPQTLLDTSAVSLTRPFAGDGMPPGFTAQEGPLLSFLDHGGLHYELTTDAALAQGKGPHLAGHSGVILAGNARWLPASLQQQIGHYVTGGGRVLSLGVESLRAAVDLRGSQLAKATTLGAFDLFGARLRPLERRSVALQSFSRDTLQLFAGTDGLLHGYDAFEETASLGRGATLQSGAGVRVGHPVLFAERLGSGLVLRTGLEQWSSRLGSDANTSAIARRMWTLLSR